ncbi:mucin-2 isoform X7 [Aedes aegypti]|nr:mucin-2 isoform X7 [Aedes aegypti]
MKNKLRTIFNVVEEVNLLDSKDEANLALLKRPELGITFTKLHCWRLTQFEKCVFLDADTLVLRNCDELFEREELSAAPDVGWPDCFNSGVYVFRPSLETFSNLMQYAVTNGSFDGGDQGLLNSYFSDWAHKDIAKHLPFIYNTSSVASYSYLPAFKQFGQNTKILHFIGTAKPWLQNFNSESRKVYIPGGYQHLANFLQYWWDIFCEDVHSRLSADMSDLNTSRNNNEKQQTFSSWIKPSQVSTSSNAYRSSGTGSFYTGDRYGGDHCNGGGGEGSDGNGNYNNTGSGMPAEPFHPQWEQFVPSYDAKVEYVDPWEEYLRKQEEERDRSAREQQKREEERLYYQYLDNQRLQEQLRRDHEQWHQQHQQPHHDHHNHHHQQDHHQHHQHHHHQLEHHHDHHGHQQDANVFQSTEQWVENVHRHDHSGHWDPEPASSASSWKPDNVQQQGGGGSGSGHAEHFQHHHHQEHHQQGVDHGHAERHDHDGGRGSGSGDHQHHHQPQQQDHHHSEPQQPQQEQHMQGGGDGSGLAGALSQLHLGEPKSTEQEVYEEHMRRQCWESGNIDYMGRDSFENIWRRISQTVSAGPSPAADSTASPAPSSTPLRAVSPAPRRHRSSKSRSRSTTPKRDPRDRSPTPQPEDIVPVEKKEVQIEAPIQEEDDNLNVAPLDGSAECRKLPPPVQYDPMTSTTTLTKKVFAGYQQIITTKTQEGKTHTRTKTVYDPSVDDDLAGDDAIDGPMHVTSATVAESRIEPAMPLVESETKTTPAPPTTKITTTLEDTPTPKPTPAPITTETAPTPPTSKIIPAPATPEETIAPPTPKPTPTPLATETAPAPPTSKTTPPPAPVPEPEHKSTPPRASPRPQLEQQVAQESMAGKEPSVEPIKTIRRKRLASPQASSATTTSIVTQTIASPKPKPKSKSTVALKTASAAQTTTAPSTPTKPKATPQEPTKTKPATSSQSPSPSSKSQSLPSPSSSASSPPPPPKTTLSSTNGKPKPTKKSIEEIETAPLTANDELDNVSAPVTPPVPPRRKRETKVSRIVQILASTVSSAASYCSRAVKSVVRTTFTVAVDAMMVFSLLVVCFSLATFTPSIESY